MHLHFAGRLAGWSSMVSLTFQVADNQNNPCDKCSCLSSARRLALVFSIAADQRFKSAYEGTEKGLGLELTHNSFATFN